jgi:2-(1,2-epoxy-1,2-dihydrophenyl)acetyl-CoA isomerase
MTDDLVRYDKLRDTIVSLRLNRPDKLNAVSRDLEDALLDSVRRASADEAVRAVVISGAGRSFCAGWDLGEATPADPRQQPFSALAGATTWLELIRLLRRPDKVFIAAVHGWVAGQGLELSLACDFVVAAGDARFYFAETRVGFAMTSGAARLLPAMVGLSRARMLMLTGATVGAEQAERIGLACQVTSDGEHEAAALTLAARIADGAPLAVAAQKMLVDSALDMSLSAAEHAEVLASMRLSNTDDLREAQEAFAAKRPAVFAGR